jgi:hypothetical protein
MPARKCELVGGPQDGAKVQVTGTPPVSLHVGPKWLGDGLSAWSREPAATFPAEYTRDTDDRYTFSNFISK